MTYTFAYAYDAVGNRTAQTQTLTNTLVTNYVYDAANRLTSVNGQAYTWDNNGNLKNDGSKVYTYTQANRLVMITANGLTWNATYNSDGTRLKQIVNSVPTTYTQDLAAPLPVVLQAKTDTTTTLYLFDMGTRPLAEYNSAWEYLLPDALGSVRQLVDGNGNATLSESYEPYGSLLSSQGSTTSVFGFTGEQIDSYTELLFLRARHMQPTLGVFLSRDPWSGDDLRPGSMNGWNYVEGNPVNRTDPSGKRFICFINPIGFLICVLVIGGMIISSGCTTPEIACPSLPDHLKPNAIGDRQHALQEIQNYFGINLPPSTTTIYRNRTTTYRFVYAESIVYGLNQYGCSAPQKLDTQYNQLWRSEKGVHR